jgi:thioredoxin
MEHLNLDTFKEKVFDYEAGQEWAYKGDLPCLIDFYADWCGPCRMVGPVLEELAKEYEGKVHIYKVNTENEPQLSAMFDIRSIPSLLFIPQDGKPQMMLGALPKSKLSETIDKVLLGK